jgi:hypothetical protein
VKEKKWKTRQRRFIRGTKTKARDQLAQPFQVKSKPNLNQGDAKGKRSRTEKRRFIPRFNQKPVILEMVVRCHGGKIEIAEIGSTAIVNQNETLRHSGMDQDKTLQIHFFSIRFSSKKDLLSKVGQTGPSSTIASDSRSIRRDMDAFTIIL